MNLSSETIAILKNFATINNSILFRPGQVLSTMSPLKTILASATVKEQFPIECGIYEINKLLGIVSLMDNPELTFEDKYVLITSGHQKVRYMYCSKDVIHVPPPSGIKFPTTDVSFELTKNNLSQLMKAINVLSLPEVCIRGDEGVVTIEGVAMKNSSGDTYSMQVGTTDRAFKMYYKIENLKFITADYRVDISSKRMTRFAGPEVEYLLMAEKSSSFE